MALPEIFPTELDVGDGGLGRVFTESNWLKLFSVENSLHRGVNYVKSGLDQSGVSGLDVTYNGGIAVINGYVAEIDSDTVSLADDATNYVYVQLTRDVNGNVDGVTFNAETTTTPPADSVLIRQVVTSGGAVSGTQNRDARIKGPNGTWGQYVGNGAASNRQIQTGFTPLVVIAADNGTAGDDVWGIRGRGMTFGFASTDAPGAALTTSVLLAPLPVEFGFSVRGGGTPNNNESGVTYDFVAIG